MSVPLPPSPPLPRPRVEAELPRAQAELRGPAAEERGSGGEGKSFLASLTLALFLLLPSTATASGAPAHDRVFVPVLTFHHVKWDRPSDDAIELGLTIHPAQFDQEVAYLASHGYRTVTAQQVVNFLRSGTGLPAHPVVLSFDDGYADVYTNVYPQLRKRHMVATLFIAPGLLGKPRYLSWRQMEEMARHGMDVEAHSMTHPDLTLVPHAQAWAEILQSRQQLQTRLRRPVRVFAYPYGSYDATILNDVRRAGYWAAFTTRQGWWQQAGQAFTLPRVYVDRDDSLAIFAGRLRADPAILAQDPS